MFKNACLKNRHFIASSATVTFLLFRYFVNFGYLPFPLPLSTCVCSTKAIPQSSMLFKQTQLVVLVKGSSVCSAPSGGN